MSVTVPRTRETISSRVVAGPNGCWMWIGSLSPDGYGRLGYDYAHRVSYEQFVGAIPDGFDVDHLCRNPRCCRPDHLEAVTHQENIRRGYETKGHVESCHRGHPYDEENTYHLTLRNGRVARYCKACVRINGQAYRARKRAAA